MKIERFLPVPPPSFTMTFTQDEGWTIVAALKHYAGIHRQDVRRDDWNRWAQELDRELRRKAGDETA